MLQKSCVFAALCGVQLLALAPSARADGFYVTFASGSGAVTGRLAGAEFDASQAVAPAPNQATGQGPGKAHVTPAHIEIDSSQALVPLLGAVTDNKLLNVTVEFTSPDAKGQEQVYMTAKYKNAHLTTWTASFSPQSSPTLKNAIDFAFQTVEYNSSSAPSPTQSNKKIQSRIAAKVAPVAAPIIRRLPARPAPAAEHVDDAYLQLATVPGESTDHPGQIRLSSFSLEVMSPADSATGMPTGKMQLKPVAIVKATGAATPALKSALARNAVLQTGSISFNQHHAGKPDQTIETLSLNNLRVASDSMQVSGSTSNEALTLVFQKAELKDNASAQMVQFGQPSGL
jgi:type VI secretion system Hcp family effector